MEAILLLEDGRMFRGRAFGQSGEVIGEVVFNTSMTGYQEIITDPSYRGQIVTMTYPLIGNYGTNAQDTESREPHVKGFIVKEQSLLRSNYRSTESLSDYFRRYGIMALEGIDTRALVKHIRVQGAMKGIISTTDSDTDSLMEKLRKAPGMVGRDLVCEVTTRKRYEWTMPGGDNTALSAAGSALPDNAGSYHVVAYDFGVKHNILRLLVDNGAQVTVVGAETRAADVLALKPDGVFLSNGPGDPAAVTYAVDNIRELLKTDVPMFGICLGHQLLCLAAGARTYKLKFGHRGANHPVKNLLNARVEITSQNHGFNVEDGSLAGTGLEPTHVNLNDKTIEGVRHVSKPVFSVQYHPEASPGPHDSNYLFAEFFRLIKQSKENGK